MEEKDEIKISLNMNLEGFNQIIKGLAELPYKDSYKFIADLQKVAQEQIEKQKDN